MTSYDVIYERFAQKITDYKLLELSDEDVETMLLSWLMSAIAKFRRCEHNLSQRDDELKKFEDDLNDTEIEILSLLMVNEWLEPQVNSVLYTSQFFGGKEEKFYAQANQLEKLMTLKKINETATQKLMRDYGYQKKITEWMDAT
mgnify:FL=1